jgi:AcrR family transcriptional regulator
MIEFRKDGMDMPPKTRILKDDILETAFEYVRQNGWRDLSVRYLAKQLKCSTMPIYSSYGAMEHLEEDIVEKAMEMLWDYMVTPRTGDVWLDHAVGVISFAIDEKHLWRSINDEKHVPIRRKFGKRMWSALGKRLGDYPLFRGLSANQVEAIQRVRWIFTHGFACLLNNQEWPGKNQAALIDTIRRVSEAIVKDFRQDPHIRIGPSMGMETPAADGEPNASG